MNNYLTSIFSEGNYFYLDPRTLQVLFSRKFWMIDRDKLGYFFKERA